MDLPIRIESATSTLGLNLHIVDHISGITLLDVTIPPERVYAMITGHNMFESLDAFVLSPASYAEKVGLKMHIFSRKFPGFVSSHVAKDPSLREWGESLRKVTQCTSFNWGHHNDGMSFTLRLYSNDLTEAQAALIQEELDHAPIPAVLAR